MVRVTLAVELDPVINTLKFKVIVFIVEIRSALIVISIPLCLIMVVLVNPTSICEIFKVF
jgi:hypothetical protein